MKNKNLIFAMLFFITAFLFASCNDEQPGIISSSEPESESGSVSEAPDISENGTNPDDADITSEADNHHPGFIYIQSNDAVQNSILIYRQNYNGTLALQTTVPSGGAGSGGGLGNAGALSIQNDEWLFAVNAGSNSVSSFKISYSGNLILKHTIETGGKLPVSLTINRHTLYVLNAGSDNISGFRVHNNGSFSAIPGSIKALSSSGAGGAQISFSPNGRFLYITEKATNMITTFPVNNNGSVGNRSSIPSTGQTPFGFDIARDLFMIVSNAAGGAPNQSSATSYGRINAGNPTPINGAVGNNQAAACWVASAKYGRFAFVTNTASGNISSYFVSPRGRLFVIHEAIPAENGPTEIIVSKNNRYVYALNSVSHTISSYRRTILGGLTSIGTTAGVPDAATGIAAK
jgi:6-phosphogluconolactonase